MDPQNNIPPEQQNLVPQPLPIEPTSDNGVIKLMPPKKPSWFSRHKKLAIILIIVGVLLIGGGAAAYYFLVVQNKPTDTQAHVQEPEPEQPKPKYYGLLTGVEVESESDVTAPVTGVMIENSPDARPQSGLKNSGVVFEAIAEGGITRFMVLYQAEKPQLIGPVRSVRLYDVDWLKPFNAGLAHVGGSARALSEIRNGQYRDLDQFFNSAYYWRSTDRYAPHNVYTSFEKLDALNKAKGFNESSFTGFKRQDYDPTSEAQRNATQVDVNISSFLYNSSYKYNANTNSYDRSQGGAPHLDREDGQISPTALIVMKVDQQTVLEDGYRESINTIGSGKAHIFQNGVQTDATWHKDSKNDQIYFTDVAGDEIALARGQTWIIAVPNATGSVTWQ